MNRPLQEYVEHADKLAQDVVNTWGSVAEARDTKAFTELEGLFEKCFAYRATKDAATREAFAIEYQRYIESGE